MGMGYKNGQMEVSTRENSKTGRNTEKELICGQMVASIQEDGSKTCCMVMVSTSGSMADIIRESG